jgi:predicted RNA binding protein YcfA (HicA-like mRNA interferase family)
MTKLRLIPYQELKKVVEKAGFYWVRREGSHNTFRNEEGRIIVIPDHGSQVIVRPLLRKILRDIGMNLEDYLQILEGL